jgi:hypothetical protein
MLLTAVAIAWCYSEVKLPWYVRAAAVLDGVLLLPLLLRDVIKLGILIGSFIGSQF